jgi:hypothetical protein
MLSLPEATHPNTSPARCSNSVLVAVYGPRPGRVKNSDLGFNTVKAIGGTGPLAAPYDTKYPLEANEATLPSKVGGDGGDDLSACRLGHLDEQ